jgi:hypothetical protein
MKHHTKKMYGGADIQIHVFLTLALAESEWSASRHGRFIHGGKSPSTNWIGGWVGPRASLDNMRRENSWPYWDSELDPLVIQLIASHYTDCAIPALRHKNKKE